MKLFNKNLQNNPRRRKEYFSFLVVCLSILILSMTISLAGLTQQEEELKKSIQIINPRPDFSLSVSLDKGTVASYSPGENIKVYFRTNRNAYVAIFGYDSHENIRLLFPNKSQQNHFVEANSEYRIEFRIDSNASTGIEFIQGFATSEPAIITRELERRIREEEFPIIAEGINRFNSRIKSVLSNLAANRWVSSETLQYQVAEMRSETGRLRVDSSPSGADVYLNERHAGETPLSMEQIRIGEYNMRVQLSGYREWNRIIHINPDRTTIMHASLERMPQYGTIAIRCNRDNAKIYVNNQYKGLTDENRNVLLGGIPEGTHEVRVILNGYREWNRRIEVRANERVQLTVNLERISQTGTLEIFCNVDNARIYINGDYQGRTFSNRSVLIRNIREGNYELRVTKEGYQDYVSIIRIYLEQTLYVNVRMQSETVEDSVSANINIEPATLNLKSNISWITVYVNFSGNYSGEDINISTVRLSYEDKGVSAEWGDLQKDTMMLKFDGNVVRGFFDSSVSAAILRLTGELYDGKVFRGSDTIRVIKP